MSLFSSIQLANNSLRANQIGLQVTGQNIANANTPGYIREEATFSTAPTQRLGRLLLGLGVEVSGIVQKVDKYLEERLRGATSERAGAEIEEQSYLELEALYAELGTTDLSTSLTKFFNAIQDVASQPESPVARNLAILSADGVTDWINSAADNVFQLRYDTNQRIGSAVNDINRLVEEVRVLNLRISEAEGTDTSYSDAVGLRDQRQTALANLAKLIDIDVHEQENGAVSVFVGGEYLVQDGIGRSVKAAEYSDRGMSVFELRLVESNAPLKINAGEVAGLTKSRDDVLGGFLDKLDNFANSLVYEFNRVYSSGQGLTGFQSVTSEWAVDVPASALDAAGLPFTPTNGAFQILVKNKQTGLTETTDIPIDLNGLDGDATLADLAAAVNAVDGIAASINSKNQLTIASDSAQVEFAFANDTSGVLTALGINTFFTGDDARTIGIDRVVASDPLKFAASRGGVGVDEKNALALAGLPQQGLESQNGLTLFSLYEEMTASVAQGSSVAHAVAEGGRVFEDQLRGQSQAISGVSIDEEILKMIRYQRSYQASAKYIAALDELLQTLVAL